MAATKKKGRKSEVTIKVTQIKGQLGPSVTYSPPLFSCFFVPFRGINFLSFVFLCLLTALLFGGCSSEVQLADLWLTPDQQAERLFDEGKLEEAAEHFEDPMWKGTALYLNEDFEGALGQFARVATPEGWFGRGNALAHLERYEEAIEAYEQALKLRPGYSEALRNIEYLQPFLPLKFEGGDMGTTGRDAEADDFVFDEDNEKLKEQGKDEVLEEQGLSEEQLAEIWLRQVDTSPASFLRHKFRYQVQVGEE